LMGHGVKIYSQEQTAIKHKKHVKTVTTQ